MIFGEVRHIEGFTFDDNSFYLATVKLTEIGQFLANICKRQ